MNPVLWPRPWSVSGAAILDANGELVLHLGTAHATDKEIPVLGQYICQLVNHPILKIDREDWSIEIVDAKSDLK